MRRVVTTAVMLLCAATAVAQTRTGLLFRADGFPTVDATQISDAALQQATSGLPIKQATSIDELKQQLSAHNLLILPYGSAFPVDAWPEIRSFVKRGGSLVVLGGAPFHQPVIRNGDNWELGTRQPAFAHDFLIGPADRVEVSNDLTVAFPQPFWRSPVSRPRSVWELTLRLSTRAGFPNEHGSEGPREAVVRALVHLVDATGLPRACPLIEIDRIRGAEAGARWIFATSDAPLNPATIRAIIERALQRAETIEARPLLASIEAGERARIRVTTLPDRTNGSVTLIVRDDAGRSVHRQSAAMVNGEIDVELTPSRPFSTGLHHVEVSTSSMQTTTGFWVRDDALLKRGPKMTVSRDWLRRDGRAFPVVGTTYMASDVHRQYLFEPNPHVFDRDFAQMKRLGINMVRTGLWTAWSRAMDANGTPNVSFLRALDAYLQSAAKHDIVVAFTFYAFLPLAHGGSNPYLDPKSLEGQRTFLTAVASRYRGVGWIHWDLINEPSYAPPEGLWSNRPIRDPHEKAAWEQWIRNRYGDDPRALRDQWHDLSDSVFDLPRDNEIWAGTQLLEDRRPRKLGDFAEFSHEVVAKWAATLRGYLRDAGGDVLVTLGQDEGGTQNRPSQQIHADSVDYTCIHPWWQNDDLLANGIFVKVPEKPSLFQETGIMRLEDIDGWHWRSPELAESLLERKFAYAFASRASGNIQWAWNINPFMPIDNESVIGFIRPDGTLKPEISVIPSHAAFFKEAAPWLDDFEPDPVIVIIPQSRNFTNRPAALDGYRRMIRLMSERLGVVPTAISDLRVTAERLRNAKLVIVPSVEFLRPGAEQSLNSAAKVLYLGAFNGGPPVPYRAFYDGQPATFDRMLGESMRRGTESSRTDNVWREPLPLEHAREEEPITKLLADALAWANVETHPSTSGVTARLLIAPRAIFGVFINDSSSDATRRITIAGKPVDVQVPAGRARLMLFERTTGRVITETK